MHSSVYSAIIQHEDTAGDMVSRLGSMNLAGVFEPLISEFQHEPETFNKALFYIIHCYSRESEMHIQNADWRQIKIDVALRYGINESDALYDKTVNLASDGVVNTIQRYLDYQAAPALKHLIMLKDMYDQMVNSSLSPMRDKDGVIDWDQKRKNAKYAAEFYREVAEWNQTLEQDEVKLSVARKEAMSRQQKSTRHSLRTEDNQDD